MPKMIWKRLSGATNIDKSRGELVAETSFEEYHSETFGVLERTCEISLSLQAQESGTLVRYWWDIRQQFPVVSLKCGQVVFETNKAMKKLCDQQPAPALVEDQPFEPLSNDFEQEEYAQEQDLPSDAPHALAMKLASAFAQLLEQETPENYSPASPPADVNMSEWTKEIRIEFPVETGYSPCIFTPDSDLASLIRLAYAYEVKDPYAHSQMDDNDYHRVLAWIKVKRGLSS